MGDLKEKLKNILKKRFGYQIWVKKKRKQYRW